MPVPGYIHKQSQTLIAGRSPKDEDISKIGILLIPGDLEYGGLQDIRGNGMGIVVDVFLFCGIFCVCQQSVTRRARPECAGKEKWNIIFFYINKKLVVLLHLCQEGI